MFCLMLAWGLEVQPFDLNPEQSAGSFALAKQINEPNRITAPGGARGPHGASGH